MLRPAMKTSFSFLLVAGFIVTLLTASCTQNTDLKSGLVGVYYSNPDLTVPKLFTVTENLDHRWGKDNGFATEWGLEWKGFVIAPASGQVQIRLQTNKQSKIIIGRNDTLNSIIDQKSAMLNMAKGQKYPIEIYYQHVGGGEGHLNVFWSWNGQQETVISKPDLVYSPAQEQVWAWVKEPAKEDIDKRQFLYADGRHVVIGDEQGYFFGWPANNGIWNWDDEILVGFVKAPYAFDVLHHSFVKSQQTAILARSLDGGETWKIEDPDNFVTDPGEPLSLKSGINYNHPDLAIRHARDRFYYSYDRGKSWNGPFLFEGMDMAELTSRTDYLALGSDACLVFLSRIDTHVKANLPDRAFCAQTTDSGKTFQFVSWMTETDTIRSVMSSTVQIANNHLISAMRRRYDPGTDENPLPQKNWIDVYESLDNSQTWQFLSKVADTDNGTRNGNPPSIVRLHDGRLCVTYGYRAVPYGIRAKISNDQGKTWGKTIILRDDAISKDIGYPRSVVRSDGKIVTTYYYTSAEHVEQHIAGTIWHPDEIK
jgi:hypothetical protein